MKETLLTILRNEKTGLVEFRKTAEKLAYILASEVSNMLEKEKTTVTTPLEKADGYKIKDNIILVPILRAALSLLPPFLNLFEDARVGFLGLKRDEQTAVANLYYKNIPPISSDDNVILLDPMIATGGSGSEAIKILKEGGASEEKIIFVAVICSQEGIDAIKTKYPKVRILNVHVDKVLNDKKFIVPGLGDFGDRYFGTPLPEIK